MTELNAALSRFISNNAATYLTSGRGTVTVAQLQTAGLLPAVYKNQTPFGGTFEMEVVASNAATPTLTGLVTTTPWVDGSGQPRYDLLGAAIRTIGSQGGVSYYNTTQVAGLNGGWAADKGTAPGQFTFINAAGQLAVRSFGDTTGYDNIYVRRDGTLPMLGNLDMGFHDINNAVNISSTGWMYANHIAANDATLGSLFSNYIRNTGGIDTAQITGIGASSAANFEYLTARTDVSTRTLNSTPGSAGVIDVGVSGTGTLAQRTAKTDGRGILNVQDVFIRDARGSGAWLSDRLPKFSSRGVYFVTDQDTIIKPSVTGDTSNNYTCSYGGAKNGTFANEIAPVARVEIIPQTFFTQGKTDGAIDFSGTSLFSDPSGVVYGTIQANPDLNTITNFRAYAQDNGNSWTININNWGYYSNTYPFNSGWALAHVYCDYS